MPGNDTNQKVNVYNLGEKGVNLAKSPLHLEDGELVAAQNAEFYLDEGLGAIRKRPGLQRFNSSVLAGAVRGVIGVPLPGPGARSVFAQRPSSPWFRTSSNGTTWADGSGFQTSPRSNASFFFSVTAMLRSVMTLNQFFYPALSGAANDGLILGYDGTSEYELVRFAAAGTIRTLCLHRDNIIFVEGSSGAYRVWSLDPVTGELTQVGADIAVPEEVYCAVSYQGKVWIGTARATTGVLYSARPGQTAWVTERTAAANHGAYVTLAVRNGELFAGTWGKGGATAAIVEKRTAAGVWSTSRTGPSTSDGNYYDGLAVMGGNLYAAYQAPNAGTPIIHIEKFDGSSWTTAVDLDSQSPAETGVFGVVVSGSSIFYNAFNATRSAVWRFVTGGSWTRVDTTNGTVTTGVMGVL